MEGGFIIGEAATAAPVCWGAVEGIGRTESGCGGGTVTVRDGRRGRPGRRRGAAGRVAGPSGGAWGWPARPIGQPDRPDRQASQTGQPDGPARPASQTGQPDRPIRPSGQPHRPTRLASQTGQPDRPTKPASRSERSWTGPCSDRKTFEETVWQMFRRRCRRCGESRRSIRHNERGDCGGWKRQYERAQRAQQEAADWKTTLGTSSVRAG